jgi:flagellar biosynthesis/type III secretory pathway chaperone
MASPHQQNWNQLHDEIKVHLQTEVHLMRELLSNLHQEGLDKEHSIQILEQRQSLLKRLEQAKEQRIIATQKLETLIDPKNKGLKLEQILPLGDDQTAEVLSLNDQLGALTKKMEQQNIDNQNAIKQGRRLIKPKPLKKKPVVATQEKNT